jgi:hypothetical protein
MFVRFRNSLLGVVAPKCIADIFFGKLSVVYLRQFRAVSQLVSISAQEHLGSSGFSAYFITCTLVFGGVEETYNHFVTLKKPQCSLCATCCGVHVLRCSVPCHALYFCLLSSPFIIISINNITVS